MGRFIYSEDSPPPQYNSYFISERKRRRRYGPMRFLFDCFMTIITSGLWLIWVFVREMRRR